MPKNNHFWPSYADLMTSLFFVMMVLYVLTFVKLKHDQEEYRINSEKFEKIRAVENSLATLDNQLFDFDQKNKRYKLKTEATFKSNSCNIYDIDKLRLNSLIKAGRDIYKLIDSLGNVYENVNYLLVLEGNTARSGTNYIDIPDQGYRLSYCRALALYNFWAEQGYDFRKLDNCELMVSGSGHFGKSRESDERKNKRFTIQITGKLGEFRFQQANSTID